MDGYELAGDYYEMGREFGAQLARAGTSLEAISAESLDRRPEIRRFARDCEPLVAEYAPGLLRELEGIADRTGVDARAVKAVALALNADPGCTLTAISATHTTGDGPLFARNHDFFPSFRAYSKLYRTRPANGLASVGCAHNFVGRLDGINEAGLAIGFAGVPTAEYAPGFVWPLAVRCVLDTCRTVEAAVARLAALPHARNVNFLVADAGDRIALVEASPDAVQPIRPEDGFARATNQFSTARMQADQSLDRVPADCSRFRRLGEWFHNRTGPIELADLQTVMGDPEAGVCWPVDEYEGDDPRATIWSWTMEVGAGVGHLARDAPVETPYESIDVPRSAQ